MPGEGKSPEIQVTCQVLCLFGLQELAFWPIGEFPLEPMFLGDGTVRRTLIELRAEVGVRRTGGDPPEGCAAPPEPRREICAWCMSQEVAGTPASCRRYLFGVQKSIHRFDNLSHDLGLSHESGFDPLLDGFERDFKRIQTTLRDSP